MLSLEVKQMLLFIQSSFDWLFQIIKKCIDGIILFLVLQLQETMVQGAVEEVVDMEGGAVTEFLQACHG